ncbi:MAG: DUF47 family protein [Deltaproteobacteria bacterium]|jgi:predicted phosphate transport protein (TIGR00153 family)|nr:DUF47 family protein [Deltaproteobacteria bacterium]
MSVPFFGILARRSPLSGLLEHYELIAKGMLLIERSMGCFISQGGDLESVNSRGELAELIEQVNFTEDHADKVKRNIRNHMPRGLFMPVDRVLFFTYTRQQDDILDAGQASLYWLSMRSLTIPEPFQAKLIEYIALVGTTIKLLRPALEVTIALLSGKIMDREEVKNHYRAIRNNHKEVNKMQSSLVPVIFNSSMDFKEIYQLTHFVEQLQRMSHSAEGCSDMLRAMIAK